MGSVRAADHAGTALPAIAAAITMAAAMASVNGSARETP